MRVEIIRPPKSLEDLLCGKGRFMLTEPLCFFNDPRGSAKDLRALARARDLTPGIVLCRGEETSVAPFANGFQKRYHARTKIVDRCVKGAATFFFASQHDKQLSNRA